MGSQKCGRDHTIIAEGCKDLSRQEMKWEELEQFSAPRKPIQYKVILLCSLITIQLSLNLLSDGINVDIQCTFTG